MPPWCRTLGGSNVHLRPLYASSAAMLIVFHFSIPSRSSFSAPIKFVPLSDKITGRTPMGDEPLHSHYAGTGVHGRDNFNMDGPSSQTSEEKSPPLLGSPTNGDVEWAEVIDPVLLKVGEWHASLYSGRSAMIG